MKEIIEQIKTDVQFRRKKGIDFNHWCTSIHANICVLKCPGPAVAAAEVAVVGKDEVEVQKNPSYHAPDRTIKGEYPVLIVSLCRK